MTYPSGRIVIIARNSLGQVTAVTTKLNAAAAIVNVATALAYKPQSDLLTSITHGNGLVTSAGYDLDYRLTSLNVMDGAALVSGRGFAYADGFNLTGITDSVTAANSNVLSYSPANRLAAASGAWGADSFTYDGVGNRLSDVTATLNRQSTYALTSNRLNSMTQNGAAFRSYTYDGAGNTLTEVRPGESFAYTYNKRNRLASVTRNTVAYGTYVYNGLQQLASRTSTAAGAPIGAVHYIYDFDGHLIAEATGATGANLRDYIWLPSNDNQNDTYTDDLLAANNNAAIDLPLAVAEAATLYTIHTDHLGRPIRMTNGLKATVWQATWKPWGEVQSISGTITNNLRFPGQYFQIETGLVHNWHRTYDPVTGRYTQPDPLGFVDGPSIYAYAGNSPFMNVDREGLRFHRYIVAAGAGLGGGIFGVGYAWWKYGDCLSASDYARAFTIGASIGAASALGGGKMLKAKRYFGGNSRAKLKYPKKAGRKQDHHNDPIYLGGPQNGQTTNLNGSYHQQITNEFRSLAPYRNDRGYNGPVSRQSAQEIARKVYNKYPLTWW